MIQLSHTEAFVLDLVKQQKTIDISECLMIYACAFLDHVETMPEMSLNAEEFLIKFWAQQTPLLDALTSLQKSKQLVQKTSNLFDGFSHLNFEAIKISPESQLFSSLKNAERRKVVEIFNDALTQFLKKHNHKGTKYELRYFWPQELMPEVIDFGTGLFEAEAYTYKANEDVYWIYDSSVNIKVRGDELHIKECIQNIDHIGQFSKKSKIKLPLKTPLFDSESFESITVRKQRYMRKFEDKTKVELSTIQLKGQEWKTICLESKSFETVLALSLFINPEGAERLTYTDFVHKYGRA